MLTAAQCLFALKWKKQEPPSLLDLHSRTWDVKQMENLTASLNDSLDTHKRIWELWDLLEAPLTWILPKLEMACADGDFGLQRGPDIGGYSSLSSLFSFFFSFHYTFMLFTICPFLCLLLLGCTPIDSCDVVVLLMLWLWTLDLISLHVTFIYRIYVSYFNFLSDCNISGHLKVSVMHIVLYLFVFIVEK